METKKSDIEYKEPGNWKEESDRLESYHFKVIADSMYEKSKNISNENIKYALEKAMYFQRQARSAIIYEEHDYERKYTDLAYIYSQIAIEKNSRRDVGDILSPNQARYLQYKTRYLLEWYKTDIESAEYEDKIDQLSIYYTRKKSQELNTDTIYDPSIFYDYILEYISAEESNKDMYNKLETVFMTFFSELEKNKWTLRLAYSTDENLIEIYYIWYKYFKKVDKQELTAKNVYQILRYGLFFWRKD